MKRTILLLFICSCLASTMNAQKIVTATLVGDDPEWGTTIKDENGYRYSFMNEGDELGVTKGGKYKGNVVIPEKVVYKNYTYPVTAVRRSAFQCNPDFGDDDQALKSVTLPATVEIIGADAFRNNAALTKVVIPNKEVSIETRAFAYCPNLKVDIEEPVFAFSEPWTENHIGNSHYVYSIEKKEPIVDKIRWAFFKQNHNRVSFTKMMNVGKENAMVGAYCRWNNVTGAVFDLKHSALAKEMFRGYGDGEVVLLASNGYVATRDFPSFNRYASGESVSSMSNQFKQSMAKKFGRKVKYSYKAATLRDKSSRCVAVTEFEITNREAMVVISWVVKDKEICSYVKKNKIDPEYPLTESVWNVDDEGIYGIPTIALISFDNRSNATSDNVDIFYIHYAPESVNMYQLRQKGNKLEEVANDQWYVWVDAPDD